MTLESHGILVTKADLAGQATTGSAWDDMVTRVDSGLSGASMDIQVDSEAQGLILGAAMIWSRTHEDIPSGWTASKVNGYRNLVASKIAELPGIALSGSETHTRASRAVAAYCWAADLINLGNLSASADATFRAWLNTAVYQHVWSGGVTLRNNMPLFVANTGHMIRMSVLAAARYLGDDAAIADCWFSWRRQFDSTITPTVTLGHNQSDATGSWQINPSVPQTWVQVLPDATKDGNNMSGILPDDLKRTSGGWHPPDRFNYYDANDFPGYLYNPGYQFVSAQALLTACAMLERAGYPARVEGGSGLLRFLQMLRRHNVLYGPNVTNNPYSDAPWVWFDSDTKNQQMVHLARYLYPADTADLPLAGDGQRPMHSSGFLRWAYQGRSITTATVSPAVAASGGTNTASARGTVNATLTAPAESTSTLFTDTFSGSNGTAWQGWTTSLVAGTTGGAIDVQSGRGRMRAHDSHYTTARAERTGATGADFRWTGTINTPDLLEKYVFLHFRASGGWNSARPWEPMNGYHLYLGFGYGEAAGDVEVGLGNIREGEKVAMQSEPLFVTRSFTAGEDYSFAIEAAGSQLRAKVWPTAQTEPSEWASAGADSEFTSGGFAPTILSGKSSASREILFDNLSVVTADAVPAATGSGRFMLVGNPPVMVEVPRLTMKSQ